MRYDIFPNLDKLAVPKRKLPYLVLYVIISTLYIAVVTRLDPNEWRSFIGSTVLVFLAVIPCSDILAPFFYTKTPLRRVWLQGSTAWIIQQTAYYCVFKELKELLTQSEGFAMYMEYFREYLMLIPAMIAEEVEVLFVLMIAYNLLPFGKTVRGVLAAVIAAASFGASHIFAWGFEYGVMVFTTRLFVELYFLRVMDLRPFIFFHTVNDWMAHTLRFEAMNLRIALMLILVGPAMHWCSVKIEKALGLRKRWGLEDPYT